MKFSFNRLYFIKKQYFKTQLINTKHRTQDTDTGLRTQTHAKNILDLLDVDYLIFELCFAQTSSLAIQTFLISDFWLPSIQHRNLHDFSESVSIYFIPSVKMFGTKLNEILEKIIQKQNDTQIFLRKLILNEHLLHRFCICNCDCK